MGPIVLSFQKLHRRCRPIKHRPPAVKEEVEKKDESRLLCTQFPLNAWHSMFRVLIVLPQKFDPRKYLQKAAPIHQDAARTFRANSYHLNPRAKAASSSKMLHWVTRQQGQQNANPRNCNYTKGGKPLSPSLHAKPLPPLLILKTPIVVYYDIWGRFDIRAGCRGLMKAQHFDKIRLSLCFNYAGFEAFMPQTLLKPRSWQSNPHLDLEPCPPPRDGTCFLQGGILGILGSVSAWERVAYQPSS